MIRVTLDKIASAAKNAEIGHDVYLSAPAAGAEELVPEAGLVVAARVLTDKAVYNLLENTDGRLTRLKPGDVIAGVLGHRRAQRGYVGTVPSHLEVGSRLHVLNLGGILGECTSYAPDVGKPFEVEVLGVVLHFPFLGQRIGVPATITRNALPEAGPLKSSAPIVAVVGTCMDSGKTLAACEVIHGLSRQQPRLRVAAAKLTGVALQRDVLGMQDHGAFEAVSFIDAGVPATDESTAPDTTRRILAHLNRARPDVIVVELGDGLLGEYGVGAILSQADLVGHVCAVVLAAADPVGAWGGVEILRDRFNLGCDVVTGPVTDSSAGAGYIESVLGIPAANALKSPQQLVTHVLDKINRVSNDGDADS
jgi:hypothetical protein